MGAQSVTASSENWLSVFTCVKQRSREHIEKLGCEVGREGEVKDTKKTENNQKNVSSEKASAYQED